MAELDLFNVDDQEIHDEIVGFVEDRLEETLYPGDERKIFLEIMTAFVVDFLTKKNEEFNQRFAQYAKGKILDAHGENEGCPRLGKTAATTIMEFKLSSAITQNVVIPAGTRVTPDNEHYFATDSVAVISAGQTSINIETTATEGGEDYNGFDVGQINKLVDRVEYIATVKNLTATSGGDNGEPYPEEDDGVGDEHYYERIRLAKATKSTAGAETTYEYYAKSADPTISDVKVTSPSPGVIKLVITCTGGAVPSQDILDKVLAVCSAKDVRPLDDYVQAVGVEQVPYDIQLTYYTTANEENAVVQEIEGTDGAIDRFIEWQCSENGTDINPDRLRAEILKSDTRSVGANRVVITKPVYAELDETQIAKFSGNMTVTHEVV